MGELSAGSASRPTPKSDSSIEIGNLAALEDAAPASNASKLTRTADSSSTRITPMPIEPPRPKRTGLIVAVLLVVIGLGVVAAYAGGFIGHRSAKSHQVR